jgi:hypothetical protein
MKKSVICILGIIFIIGLATTATSYAIDLVAQALPKKVFKSLPSTIKIEPNVIKVKRISSSSKLSEFKQKWKGVTDGVAAVNARLPMLEQLAASLKQKEEECMNKQYTTGEITEVCAAAGADSIDECSRLLFFSCCRADAIALKSYLTDYVLGRVGECPGGGQGFGVTDYSDDSGRTLAAWLGEVTFQTMVPY